MIWPKQVTLVSWTLPLGPWFLWQCFTWNRVNDNLSTRVTVPSVKLQLFILGSFISIFHINLQGPYYSLVHCLSVRLGYISSSSLVSSFPAPFKKILGYSCWQLPLFGPAAAFSQRVTALKNNKDILQLLHLSRRQQFRHDLFGRFCMRQDQWQNQFLSSCSAQRKIVKATQNSPSRLSQLDTCHTSLAM